MAGHGDISAGDTSAGDISADDTVLQQISRALASSDYADSEHLAQRTISPQALPRLQQLVHREWEALQVSSSGSGLSSPLPVRAWSH